MSVNIVLKTILDDKGIKNAQKSFSKLGSTVTKLGAALGVAFSTKALVDSAKAAAEDAKSQALLATQLRNTVGANEEMIASVERSINAMQLSAAVADDQIRPAFAQLVRATGDVGQATSMMQLALDVSAGTGRDLQSVTIALSKAYQGNTTALSRLGIKVADGADAFAVLQKQFAGAAETAARNDPFQRLTVTVGELQEQIGVYLLPILNNLADTLASAEFGAAFEDLAIKVGTAIEQIDKLFKQFTGDNALTAVTNFFSAIAYEVAKLAILFQALGKSAGLWLTGRWIEAINFDPAKYVKEQIALLDKEITKRKSTIKSPAENGPFSVIIPNTKQVKKATKETESEFEKVRKIIKTYQARLLDAERDYNDTKLKLNEDYADSVRQLEKDAADERQNIIEQSINRLRDAFRNATQIGLGDLFGSETITEVLTSVRKLTDSLTLTVTQETQRTINSSVDDLILGLSKRLAASRQLLANASALASAGFSQTFIEQVLETGAETGNVLAEAILASTPEQQDALRRNFLELEDVTETGMDILAKRIYREQGLATRELKALNEKVNSELNEALKLQFEQLQKSLREAAIEFGNVVGEIKTEFEDVIDSLDGKFGGLGDTIDQLLAKMEELLQMAGFEFADAVPDLPIPTGATGEGASPDALLINKFGGGGRRPDWAQQVVNNYNVNVKTDATKSVAQTAKEVASAIGKFGGSGGRLAIQVV